MSFWKSVVVVSLIPTLANASLAESRYQGIVADDPASDAIEGPCRLIETGEELSYAKFDCGSMGDYRLFVVDADARTYIDVVHRNGTASHLALPMAVNMAFNSLPSKVVEWRGEMRNGRFEPYALIVRVQNVTPHCTSETCVMQALAVSKISPAGSCYLHAVNVASVPNANVEARRLADTTVRTAACPRD